MLVSLILFMKHGITNTTFLAFFVTKLRHFDCVSHEKLELHRLAGIVIKWFRSYLHAIRQQVSLHCTAIHCFQSDWESIKYEVPQGSDLGPLLFNIHV